METTETIPDNCVLLTPQEAAGVEVFSSLLVKRAEQVEEWRDTYSLYPRMVAGTDLDAIGFGGGNSLLCVRRGCLSEVERLRKELYEFRGLHGYEKAFQLWESWVFAAEGRW